MHVGLDETLSIKVSKKTSTRIIFIQEEGNKHLETYLPSLGESLLVDVYE
jgi:hypothetical protein